MFSKNVLICENGFLNGIISVSGANVPQCTTILVPIMFEDESIKYAIFSKKSDSISIGDPKNTWEDTEIKFENVLLNEQSLLSEKSEAGDNITNVEIEEYLNNS